MPWVTFTDDYIDDPDVMDLSDAGFRAWHEAIAYSSRHLLDGDVPDAFFKRRNLGRGRRECERAGLFLKAEDGISIRNFLKYQRSREEVEQDRARRNAAKSAGGRARAAQARREGGRFTSSAPAEPPADDQQGNQQTTSSAPAPLPSALPQERDPDPERARARSEPEPEVDWEALDRAVRESGQLEEGRFRRAGA